ncbi:MAG TPA: hypothetical protein VGX78_01585 [Pirellulales bacterium]|nr:hypothetical protein [Pirellulales bacterium]
MTLKTITAGVTLSLLACLVLASGGVFGQAPAAKSRPAARNGAAGQAVGYAAQPAANAFYALTPACSVDAAQDEESAKLIASDVQMQQESQTLLGQYAEAEGDDEKAQIKEKLAAALGKQFSAQQQLREHEIAKIEARVKKLREAINKRNEAKRSIVDKRLDQLIREAEGLGWNAPAAGPTDAWGVRFFEPDRANYMPATTGRPVYSTAPAPAAR